MDLFSHISQNEVNTCAASAYVLCLSLKQVLDEVALGTIGDEVCLLSVQEDLAGESVLLKLVNLDPVLVSQLSERAAIGQPRLISLKADFVNLRDISDVENGEAALEFVRKLRHVLAVAQGQNDLVNLVILACRQFLADATNRNNFTQSGYLAGHGDRGHGRLVNSDTYQCSEQRDTC